MRGLFARLFAAARGPMAIYLAASILARVGTILLIPLYTRRLTPEAYGDYALAQAVVAILPNVITLGIASAVHRFFFDADASARDRTATVATWLCVLSLGGGVLFEIAALVFGRDGPGLSGRWELSCMVIASVGSALASVPHVYLRAAKRPIAAAGFQLAQFLTTALAGLAFVGLLGRGLRGSIEALAVASAVVGVGSLVFILRFLRGALDRAVLREAVGFSLPIVAHVMANWAQAVTDRWTMKGVGIGDAMGGYALASTLLSPVTLVVTAYADADNPRQGEAYRDGGIAGVRARVGRARIAYLLAVLVPGIAIVASAPLLALVVGRDFVPALKLLPLLLIASAFDALYYPSVNVVYYASRTRYLPIATATAAAVNVALNLVLIPRLGLNGAIVARIATSAVRAAVVTLGARAAVRAELGPPAETSRG